VSPLPWRRPPPTPPTDVRLLREDGREVPVELVYQGWFDGAHRWVAVLPGGYAVRPGERLGLRVKSLPPKTAVMVGIRPDPEEAP
jgi:hypothetical protein